MIVVVVVVVRRNRRSSGAPDSLRVKEKTCLALAWPAWLGTTNYDC